MTNPSNPISNPPHSESAFSDGAFSDGALADRAVSEGAISETALGAIAAVIRIAELYDPAIAYRAALRAQLVERIVAQIDTTSDRASFIAAGALSDVDLAVSRPADPEAASEPTRALLGETILSRIPGLRPVATAIGARLEWWNGNGSPRGLQGEDIPLIARVLAVADAFIGTPAAGFLPSWDRSRERVEMLSGTALDPDIAQIAASLPLDDMEAPLIPSATIQELLQRYATENDTGVVDSATTIKSAIATAGHIEGLLGLFADSALRAIPADEVVVLRSTPSGFDLTPVSRAHVELISTWPVEEVDAILDFSTQAELRAGEGLLRASRSAQHIDVIATPITVAKENWGVILAHRTPSSPTFDEHDLSVLRHVALQAADAIERGEHWATMERMALRDQLTGLGNRHELYRVLDELFERPPLERLDSAVIMCDVDGLKTVNDTLGHQAGDRLLMDTATALRAAVRDSDRTTVCRIGGDEFCLVIDGGALLTAHDISDAIERLFARSAGSGEPRSISCGIAFASEDVATRSELLRAADENQYQTKRARKESMIPVTPPPAPADGAPVPDRRAIRD